MAVNMWKNSLKYVESDNSKILYETLLNFFFYSEVVLTFRISLVKTIESDSCLQNTLVFKLLFPSAHKHLC